MKIYLEEVFILNFLLDFMILYGTKRILKRNNRIIRIFIGSIVGSFTTFLLFIEISNLLLLIFKLIVSILLIIISFGFKNMIKNIMYFYLISIILGGGSYLLDVNNKIFLVISSFIFISILIKEFLSYKEVYSNKYLVTIFFNKKKYNLEGFIDTGNRLRDPITCKDVILTNIKIDTNNVIYVPYKALNTSGIIPCIRPDKVIINNQEFNCLIGVNCDKFKIDEDCILPNRFKEKLC